MGGIKRHQHSCKLLALKEEQMIINLFVDKGQLLHGDCGMQVSSLG